MAQTIDLRKKPELQVPVPPQAEPEVFEPEIQAEPQADSSAWHVHLNPHTSQERSWYAVMILAAAAAAVAIFLHDAIFAIVLGLGALVLGIHAAQPHQKSHIGIHATGISIDDQHHRFADMRSFWIHYYPPHIKEISIEFKRGLHHRIRIPLDNQNPLEIRQAMLAFVPEKEHEPSLLDHFIYFIGI